MPKKSTYMNMVKRADKEIYNFWHKLTKEQNEYQIDDLLVQLLKGKVVANREVKNLYSIYKKFPGSTIYVLGNQPILKVKLK